MSDPVSAHVGWMDYIYGGTSLLVLLLTNWCRQQERKIEMLEKFKSHVLENYVSKDDFKSLATELKDMLNRIDDKIEKLRDK